MADGPFDAARHPLEELLAKLTAAQPAESERPCAKLKDQSAEQGVASGGESESAVHSADEEAAREAREAAREAARGGERDGRGRETVQIFFG